MNTEIKILNLITRELNGTKRVKVSAL